MTEEEETFTLRDKLAIEMFKLIVQETKWAADCMESFVDSFETKDKSYDKNYHETSAKYVEHKMRAAYKLADLMRKTRLGAFE